MSAGTTISVSGTGLTIDGNANLTMPDTQVGGPGLTTFTIIASDADPKTTASPPNKSVITLTINHPVYGEYKQVLAVGTVE